MINVAPVEFGFCVSDLEQSLQFYGKVIGLKVVSTIETDAIHAIRSGFAYGAYRVVRLQFPTGERLKLFAPHHTPVRALRKEKAKPLAQTGFAFFTLIVKDLSAVLKNLEQTTYNARSPGIYELRAGVFVALLDDPDGNLIELVEYKNLAEYRNDLTFPEGQLT